MRWKEVTDISGLKMNMGKTKLVASDVCGRGVGASSGLSTQCDNRWCHKRYSGLRCPKCTACPQCPGKPPLGLSEEVVKVVKDVGYSIFISWG